MYCLDIFLFSINATLPVVLCMAVGILLRWRKTVDQPTSKQLSALCFKLFLPVLTFNNIRAIDFRSEFSPRLLTYAFLGVIATFSALLIVFSFLLKDKEWLAACVHVGFRSNYIMLGIPLAQNMFGQEGVQIASMLIPMATIPFNFLTLFLFSLADTENNTSVRALLKSTVSKVVQNPLITAIFLGILASLSGFSFPAFLEATLRNIGGVASTLCLIALGTQITLERKQMEDIRTVAVMCLTRLVFVPAVMIPIFVALGFRGAELGALFVLFASPCANSCGIMAQQYNIKPLFTAQVVGATTLFSGLTTFIGIFLLKALGLF
jgi:predicted permease